MGLVSEAKGQFAQMLVSTMLEYAGYRVLRFGIEETISEIKASNARREFIVDLPRQLRASPDFFVTATDTGDCRLVEVKFRSNWTSQVSRELHQSLSYQAGYWPETVGVVVVSDPPLAGSQYQDYIRVIPPEDRQRLIAERDAEATWRGLRTLGSFFTAVHDCYAFHEQADQLVPAIASWNAF